MPDKLTVIVDIFIEDLVIRIISPEIVS